MLTARLTSFRLRNANLTSIFNASVMQTDQVDWSSVGIVCCHLVSLSVVKLVTFRRWDSEKKCNLLSRKFDKLFLIYDTNSPLQLLNLIPDILQKFYMYKLYLVLLLVKGETILQQKTTSDLKSYNADDTTLLALRTMFFF
ncbi:hypothetical protein T4B_3706 [Trichinella pseudospiralis]|uniref:Uncharacterized protein n=1 Tax=Trichinella pseudospiralis TaxID=6337 RepID=A0A0V1KAG7_TRIPS|nr:hypothetical protein T4B_3706 [Trichinella pseudospiralis]KRZ44180.1 hypothetical protein T4C_9476 [Trichinella pseudospiralis]